MIAIDDFKYNLPEHRIAKYPLAKRDNAQLLIYKEGNIKQDHFFNLSDYIDAHSTLVFNNTKVIPARLFFTKDTGALLEIFLLHPISPSELVLEAMQAAGSSVWACTIGNVKRWTANATLTLSFEGVTLQATLVNKEKGHVVAATTAGLHFTDHVFEKLKTKSINSEFVTLHVSAGTFMPVKTANALEHTMHSEQIIVATDVIKSLIETQNQVIVVGTTSMRTLESLYWMGVRCIHSKTDYQQVTQHEPYLPEQHKKIKPKEALEALYNQLLKDDKELLIGETSIYIHPGYDFKVCDGLITNFHQPGSTLMLLVAAFVGNDWKKIYQHALDNNFRFLSFGDSSLLWKSKT